MNENLNRAFIRAYDKEKSSEARKKNDAQKQQADALARLMVQFDTATVDIPAPHMLQARKRSDATVATAAATVASNATTSSSVSTATASQAPRRPSAEAETAARMLIEQQMQSIGWQEQALPMFTSQPRTAEPTHAASHAIATGPALAAGPTQVVGQPQAAGPTQSVMPVPTSERTAAAEAVLGEQHRPMPMPVSSHEHGTSSTSHNVPPAVQEQSSSPELERRSPFPAKVVEVPAYESSRAETPLSARKGAATTARISVPELAPPVAPALSPSADERATTEQSKGRQEAHTPSSSERVGGIFRLDRPSYLRSDVAAGEPIAYSELAHEEAEVDLSDSSETLWLDRSRMDLRAKQAGQSLGKPTTETASRNTQVEQEARAVEEKLRSAKVRIFNPVWEVDSLQWPPVCIELMHRMSNSFKHIAENLAGACQEGLQVMAVTSPQRGEGTTTVACCLALLAGSHGLNVAIVDGDIEKPNLSYQTNLDVDQDWRSALIHNLSLEEVAVHSIDDQVTVVPLLNPISQLEMLPGDERIVNMIRELSSSFDLVILDAGRVDSTRSLLRSLGEQGLISAAVAVVDHRSSTPDQIEACLRRIRQSGIHSIGLVENFAA